MKNIKAKAVIAKNKLGEMPTKVKVAGIVMIAADAASLIRTIVSMASGEQAQPGALGKGIGLIVGGAVLCALKAIVTVIIGSAPTTMTFY